MDNRCVLGARPPEGFEWMVGKTHETIMLVKKIEEQADRQARAARRIALADLAGRIKSDGGVAAKVFACARSAHEANRAYCLALGDGSQASYDDAPEWQRDSAVTGVLGVLAGDSPRESHESWLDQKRREGWKYGPVKDPATKEHPCFVPYDDLDPAQRAKDAIFVAVVRAMAVAIGLAS